MGVPAPEPNGQDARPGPSAVRVLIAVSLALVALAGCTAPDEEPQDPLFGVCPQWIGPDERTHVHFTESPFGDFGTPVTQAVDGAGNATYTPQSARDGVVFARDDWPLDRYTVRFSNVSLDAPVEVRAFADGADRRIAFTDYRDPDAPSSLLFLTLEDGAEVELDVFLSPVAHGSDAAPDGLRLEWSDGSGTMDVTVAPWFKVCGVPL